MRSVVTGSTIFIGAVTVRKLLEAGHQVDAVVRPGSKNMAKLYEQIPEGSVSSLQVLEIDLHKIADIQESVPEADCWLHTGWDGAGSENRMKRDVQQANVVQSLLAVHAAAALGCKKFLFTGSQAEYGVCHSLITEDTPLNPLSEYGIAKVDFGFQAGPLCRELGMEYIHTRIFSVYGPGDHPWSLVETCLRTWSEGGEMKLGECTQKWNYLYIEDTASALIHLLTKAGAGVYNVASADIRVLREYIEEMYDLCGRKGSYGYRERPQNAEGPANLMADITKICAATGWRPTTTFAEGINELLYRMQNEAS